MKKDAGTAPGFRPAAISFLRRLRPLARGTSWRRSRYLGVLGLLLVGILLAGNAGNWLLYRSVRETLDRQLGERLLSVASTVSMAVGPDRFAGLMHGETAAATRKGLQAELERIADANDLENILLLDSTCTVWLDLSERVVPGTVDPLQVVQPELGATLLSGEPRATELVAVENIPGEYLKTGYAALEDSTGKILGAVAVEGGRAFFSVLPGMRRRLVVSAVGGLGAALVLLALVLRVLRSLVRHEESLQRAAALAAIGQVSAIVAHEVKNPLAIIRSRAERVRARIEAGKDPREILEWFDVIPAEVDRLDAILTGYLSLARPDAEGEGECVPAVVAADTVRLLGPELERGGVRCALDTSGSEGTASIGARSLKQILLNLLLNASQAMASGGEVGVRVLDEGAWVTIEVEDSGRGMTPEERRRALEPFYTTKPTGSGLGLTLVHSLVQARGGRLEIRSAPAHGTRVTVRIPRRGRKEN